MKTSLFVRNLVSTLIVTGAVAQGNTIIGGGDGPHAAKEFVFDGSVSTWADELYGYRNGQKVVFQDAGNVDIAGSVAPGSMVVKGSASTTLRGMGQITGDTSLTMESSGTLQMNDNNTYSGGTLLLNGTLRAGGRDSFGSGSIDVSGGVLELAGYDVNNDIYLRGGILSEASDFTGRLFIEQDYSIGGDTSAREVLLTAGKTLSISQQATLRLEETLELKENRTLDLSAGGKFHGNIEVNADGILRLPEKGSAGIAPSCTWHLKSASVSGNLSTAQQHASAVRSALSTLRISGNSSISGAITLNGGSIRFSDNVSTLQVGTLVLNSATVLQLDAAPGIGESHTFLRYNRLLSGAVSDYYEFFGVDDTDYSLNVTEQSITITGIEHSPEPPPSPIIPTPPAIEEEEDSPSQQEPPSPEIPEADSPGNQQKPDSDGPHDSKDPGPVIDTSGDTEDDPHHNKEEKPSSDTNSNNTNSTHPVAGSAISQAGIQSAWGAMLASDAFMQSVHDQSRSATAATWIGLIGGIQEIDDDGQLPGGDASTYGMVIGAAAAAGESTQVGIAMGGALGTVSGSSFGDLDQTSIQAALYLNHAFLPAQDAQQLHLYLALGAGRTETDPGSYSGYDSWHHNSFAANSRLSWEHQLSDTLVWSLYGGVDYYHSGNATAGEETISGMTNTRGRIGSGVIHRSGNTTFYAEAEFRGDLSSDEPTATRGSAIYRNATPDSCGFAVHAGVILKPEQSERSVGLHYSFETRGTTTAHIINLGIDHMF